MKMGLKIILVFLACLVTKQLMAQNSPEPIADESLIVFASVRDSENKAFDHVKLITTRTSWSDGGRRKLSNQLKKHFGDVQFGAGTVKQGNCYVLAYYPKRDGSRQYNLASTLKTRSEMENDRQAKVAKGDWTVLESNCNEQPASPGNWQLFDSGGSLLSLALSASSGHLDPTKELPSERMIFDEAPRKKFPCGSDKGSAELVEVHTGIYRLKKDDGGYVQFSARDLMNGDDHEAAAIKFSEMVNGHVNDLCGKSKQANSIYNWLTGKVQKHLREQYEKCKEALSAGIGGGVCDHFLKRSVAIGKRG